VLIGKEETNAKDTLGSPDIVSMGGYTWSEPEPWTYPDGEPFFSPASMSELFTHSNGRIYTRLP
jgi:hypothetical protein